jgi:asparagine synthase (glutamine-hydrolysing)
LDHELLELAATIPSRYKVRDSSTKWILKESFRKRLPAGILDRPKQGFEIPIDEWLRGPLRGAFEERVLSPASSIGDLVERRTVRQLFDTHLSSLGRHGSALWALLVLSSWAGRYLGREASAHEIGSIR